MMRQRLKDTNLDTYAPCISVTCLGLGEPGITVVAPAIGNAIFAAVWVGSATGPFGRPLYSRHLRSRGQPDDALLTKNA